MSAAFEVEPVNCNEASVEKDISVKFVEAAHQETYSTSATWPGVWPLSNMI
jgi:hypothetical protein